MMQNPHQIVLKACPILKNKVSDDIITVAGSEDNDSESSKSEDVEKTSKDINSDPSKNSLPSNVQSDDKMTKNGNVKTGKSIACESKFRNQNMEHGKDARDKNK